MAQKHTADTNGDRSDLLRRVRRIEIVTRKTVNDVMAGAYHSVFKGQGMEFDSVRKYAPGDEVRAIDWNVTARSSEPYIKVFQESRELTMMLLIDLSASQGFGTKNRTKAEMAAELSALLAFSAIQNNDKVGLIIFTDQVEKFIPPERGRKHVLRVVSEILSFKPAGKGTSIAAGLQYLSRLKVRRTVSFLISDFQDAGYERELKLASRKHDMVAFCLEDPMESMIPNVGLVRVQDPETGETALVDLGDASLRDGILNVYRSHRNQRSDLMRRLRVDNLTISTDVDNAPYLVPLVSFFRRRAKRR